MYSLLIRRLPTILLGAAGIASLAYVAWRQKGTPSLSREFDLSSLPDQLQNWLPKLPFMPFIRLEVPGNGGFLVITGDSTFVQIHLPQATDPQRRLAPRFRRICARSGFEARGARLTDGSDSLSCRLPADRAAVADVLEASLRDLFGAAPGSKLVASVPNV